MRDPRLHFRLGMTLIELLVVIGIITALAAVTIPVMLPAVESRKMREAARGVSTFLAGARARAIEVGRPVGVHLEPMSNQPTASMVLFYAEEPPVYAGLSSGSTINFTDSDTATLSEAPPAGMIKAGDILKVNFQGPIYRIDSISSTTLELTPHASSPGMSNALIGKDLPYQIRRQPISSSAEPYQLSEGVVVDLAGSGFDSSSSGQPRQIMFDPSGSMSRVVWSDGASFAPNGTLFLLIGKSENAGSANGASNWQDPNCLWVAVGHQTGQAKAAEVVTGATTRFDSRAFARDRGVLGGK